MLAKRVLTIIDDHILRSNLGHQINGMLSSNTWMVKASVIEKAGHVRNS